MESKRSVEPLGTSAHPVPPRPVPARRSPRGRTIVGLVIAVTLITVVAGGAGANRIALEVGARNTLAGVKLLAGVPAWCINVDAVSADRDGHRLVDGVTWRVPAGPHWWLADQFAALLNRSTRADAIAQLERQRLALRQRCPLAEDMPALFPDEACAADTHAATCARWVAAYRGAAPLPAFDASPSASSRGSRPVAESAATPQWPPNVVQRARMSAHFISRVVEAEMTALHAAVSGNGWWRAPRAQRDAFLSDYAERATHLLADLPPSQRRRMVYPRLDAQLLSAPFADNAAAATWRLAAARDVREPDCKTLLALSLATETDFGRRVGPGLARASLDRRSTPLAERARRFGRENGCNMPVPGAPEIGACADIEALERRVVELAPLMAARAEHGCDLEEVLGLTKGGRGARESFLLAPLENR